MGVPINDPEDPAGYDCNDGSSKTVESCKCSCSCGSNSNSSSSSSYSNSCSSNSNSSSCCNSSNSSNCKHNNSNNTGAATTLTLTFANRNSCGAAANHYQYSKTETLDAPLTATSSSSSITRQCRDLIGNSKEYRIESNKSDLRIIGNGNRIRIGCNQGNLQIIGNNTRLKITNNIGGIRYTGNEGRICLGSDSTQQSVDYIGNNGKLKVVKAAELLNEKIKSHKQKAHKNMETSAIATPTAAACAPENSTKVNVESASTAAGNAAGSPTHSTPKKVKVKSASFAGDYSSQWQQFNALFEKQGWRNFDCASMPNLKCENVEKANAAAVGKKAEQSNGSSNNSNSSKSSRIHTKSCKIDSNINIVSTYGNICIKNAVNVSM